MSSHSKYFRALGCFRAYKRNSHFIKYQYQTIDASEIIDFIIQRTSKDLTIFFSQYLNNSEIPEFQYQLIREGRNTSIKYRWEAIKGFDMPLLVNSGNDDFWIYPNNNWKEMSLGKIDPYEFSVEESLFLIDVKKIK